MLALTNANSYNCYKTALLVTVVVKDTVET